MESLGANILKALANACNIDRQMLTADTSLADVGFDSLGAAAFASEMETAHGILLEPEDLAKLYVAETPADVIAVVGGVYMRSGPSKAAATKTA